MTDDTRQISHVAGNGLLDRRLFMRTLALGAAGTAGVAFAEPVSKGQPEWMLAPGATAEEYGTPSRFEVERTTRLVGNASPATGLSGGTAQ